MPKEGKKNRRYGLIGVIITALVPLFIWYFSNDPPKEIVNEGVIDNSEIKTNEGTINKTNVGNNSGTVINSQTNNYQITENKEEGYSIKGSKQLLLYIKNSNKINISQKSSNQIVISYTGTIVSLEENSNICQYNGGNLKIMINDIHCYTFNELVLEPIRSNPRDIIIKELEKRIDEFVEKSPLEFQNKILKCI